MSNSQPFDKEFIRELAELLSGCDLTEIEIEHKESKLRVAREVKQTVIQAAPMAAAPALPVAAAPAVAAPAAPVADAGVGSDPAGDPVTSPMVGTVYLSAEPGAAPFVKVGDNVEQGQTLLIVEAMKVMNKTLGMATHFELIAVTVQPMDKQIRFHDNPSQQSLQIKCNPPSLPIFPE